MAWVVWQTIHVLRRFDLRVRWSHVAFFAFGAHHGHNGLYTTVGNWSQPWRDVTH